MIDLFGEEIIFGPEKMCIFHDESDCHSSNFLYHGFLFVPHRFGKEILDKLEEIMNEKWDSQWGDRVIHFKELRKLGGKTVIANAWISEVKRWLSEGKIRFHFFGVDKSKLDANFWDGGHHEKIYLRFFEIGLKGGVAWFEKCSMLKTGISISYTFFDDGKLDAERASKVRELGLGDPMPLNDSPHQSGDRKSLLIQLVDVLNGVCRLSFVSNNKEGQMLCAKEFQEIIERFNSSKIAYRTSSRFYKKFSLSFFPRNNGLKKEDFLEKNLKYHLHQQDSFYCDRETCWQKQQPTLSLF